MTLTEKCGLAGEAALLAANLPEDLRNRAILAMAGGINARREEILGANRLDMAEAEKNGLAPVLIKRLEINEKKILEMTEGLESLALLPDPLGKETIHRELDAGLVLRRVSVPIGLIGVIFESRPEVLVQIAGLCVKSGNALILKGGSEAAGSNKILHKVICESLAPVSRDFQNAIILVETREEIKEILALDGLIDLIIPRGSNQLVRYIMENTKIPVMGHADGICHLYVDRVFDREKSLAIIRDSKTQYPAVCNAAETLLVHRDAAEIIRELPELFSQVELRGCPRTREIIPCAAAGEDDWDTEYNDLILAVKVVDSLDEAVDHINTHGSHHTDVILTEDPRAADEFMARVDSASVMHNCSSRFSDGFRYGFGAEVGISTGKIHARGPVGLEGLTIYKYRLRGDGHIVDDYARGARKFTHKDLA